MNTKKHKLSLLMAGVLLFSSLTACNNNNTKPSESNGGSNGEDNKPAEIMNEEGLPIIKEGKEYSFKIFVDDSSEDDDFVMLKQFEEETGVKVNLEILPYSVATERLSLDLNTGEYADVIGGWILGQNDIMRYGMDEKLFIPLNDLYDKYAPNINKILDLKGVRDTMTLPDGNIYTIPFVTETPAVDFNLYVNTKWLEKVNKEIPTTTEELKDVLLAFKENDANGNGDANDEIPFSADPNNKHISYMAGYWGKSLNDIGLTISKDGKIEFGADSDAFKNMINYFADLNNLGLVDNELFTQELSNWKAKGGQDKYGVVMMYGAGDIMPFEAGEKPDWAPVPVLKSEGTDNPVWLRHTYGNNVFKTQAVITDKAENPEIIVRWWDYIMSDDASVQTQNGPFGKTIEKVGESKYKELDRSSFTEEDNEYYNWANLFPQSLPKFNPGFDIEREVENYPEKDIVDEVYGPNLTEAMPKYWVSGDNASELADISKSVEDFISNKIASWISGTSNVDEDWDAYVDQLKNLNYERMVEIINEAIGE